MKESLRWAIRGCIMLPFRLLAVLFRPLAGLVSTYVNRLLARMGGELATRRRRAQRAARLLISELVRLGFSRKIVTGHRRGKVRHQRIRFEEPLLMTADELWCPIDHASIPTGRTTDELRDESVLRSLTDRTDCAVRIDYLANGKMCYVVRYGGAAFPDTFSINGVEFPENAPSLSIPAGVNADGDQTFIDLDDVVHLLIAGATGNGKTVFVHAALTSLINRNTAEDLELWLVDLKQTEFSLYRSLWSKRGDGIVQMLAVEPEDAIDLLDRAQKEIDRRNALMVSFGCNSLEDLNRSAGVRLRKVVIVIDEFAQLTLNTTRLGKQSIGKIAENRITRVASLGRSAGFRIIIATQMVQSAVVSSLIRANFENRVAFSTADWRQSQLIVESSEADGLPKGRAVLKVKGGTQMVQTALISGRQVKIEVERVAKFGPDGAWGEQEELARFARDAKLIISAACQHLAGELARSKLLALDGVRGVISQDRFNEVCARLERDGVLEPGGPRRPRRVARAFFNRGGLLDTLYGRTVEQTVIPADDYGLPVASVTPAHQGAEYADEPVQADTVYGLKEKPVHGPELDEEPALAPAEPLKRKRKARLANKKITIATPGN